MQKRLENRRKRRQIRARTRFLGLIERLEERLPLTGPYVNAPIAPSQAEFLLDGAQGLSGMGDRIDRTGDSAQPLGPFKNRDGSQLTPGMLGPFGRTLREELENPIDDFFDATPVDQRTTDALVAHLGSFPAYLSIEGGLVDGTIDELVFDVHIQREYELSLLNIEFDSEDLPTPFYSKNGIEANLTAVVDFQFVFGISLDPSLNAQQAFFVRDVSMTSSIRADSILHPFTVNFGFLEASVPDVVLAANLDIEYSPSPTSPSLRLTEIDTLEVTELFSQRIGSNDFQATFNLDIGVGRWRLEGSTYLQAIGDFLGFEPAITFSPNFDEVFLFNHISSDEVVAGMESFQSWLTSWGNSSQYDVKIPFSKEATAGSVFNAGQAMSDFTDSLRDEDGNPAFDNAADFPYSGNGIDYNPTTNKLKLTVVQNLPGQQQQSRSTRLELDDTVGLSSQTEAEISGGGTVSFVVSIDLSQESVDFRDRIAIEDLRVRTFYGTEAVVLTGNAAFGGLGIAFANGVLSGEISTEALFRSTWNGSPLTLRILNDTIDIAGQYLRSEMQWAGNSLLRLPSLLVSGNLFQIASDAFVEINVTDIKNSVYETTTNVPDFWNFASLAFEDLTDTLSDAILGTESWDSQGDEAVATLGVTLDDFGPLKQNRIVDTITEAVENADTAVGFSRKIVQDVSDFVEDLEVPTASGAIDFVSDVAYDTATGIFSWFVDASADETTTVNTGLGFESLFGYTSDPNVDDTSNLVGEQTSLQALTTSRLQLGLEFDPSGGMGSRSLPNVFLNSRSRLDRTLYINNSPSLGNAVTIEGASGALGLRLNNGSVVIAQDLTSPDPARPAVFHSSIPSHVGRVRITDLPTYQPERQAVGSLLADFEVVPDHTGNPEPDRLSFQTLQFADPTISTTLLSSPDFPQLRRGLDLQVNLDALVPSLESFLKQLEARIIDEVLDRAYPLIGDKLDEFANFIEPIRQAITTALDALSSFRVSDIENAIDTALRNLFNRPNRDFVQVDIQSPTIFKMTLDINNAPISVTRSTRSDLGLPALGIDWTSDFSVIGRYGFQMTFVLDVNEGFYVETDTDSIQMILDMNMVGQATGKLGFFEVIATAEPPLPGQSAFHAEYVIDVTEPSGDDKLFLNEIGTGPLIDTATSGLSGEAHMSFSIEAAVNAWLPSIETGLRIDWEFDGIGFTGSNPPEVTYEGIQLHLGRLLNDVFLPFFETIQDVFAPMQPIIDILTQPLPVISEFADPDPTILDLALLVKDGLPEDVRKSIESLAEFVVTLDTINDIVQAIQVDASSGLSLQLGDITFGGVANPQFDARMSQLDRAVLDLANETSDLRGQFDGASGAPTLSASLNSSPGSLHLPIIENPLSAIGWILGVDEAELITWDLPKASVSFPLGLEFPIFPGILASIFGGLEVGFDFKVGLDTAGFEDYSKSRDFKDLFNGFYVSDRANADGTGEDVNEIFVRGDLLAGAGVGFSVAGVGVSLIVGGGVFSEVGIDLIDHDRDGKVRGRDFSSPDGCFALNGEFGVALEARAKAGIFKFELPITEVTLAKGRQVIGCPFYEPPPPTILAGLDAATGTLTLFMGPDAHQRNVQPNTEEENFSVMELPGEIIVTAFGSSQSFAANDVRNIVADGGTKDDRITLQSVTKPSILRGGEGDDVIHGGANTDVIDGGPGRDELYGGGENDILIGDIGADLLDGQDGDDDLYGDEGDDDLYGGLGNDEIWTGDGRNVAYGDEGNDVIVGGRHRDVVYGGENDDTIDGGAGPDVLNGDSGVDTIRGREGDDLIDGGSDGDFLFGDEGDDRLWGRSGVDELFGGIGLDYLNGNEDGDILYGQGDADEIDGDVGDDQIFGGPGDDTIYGRAGFDTIEGGNDRDLIYGGADGDTISGGRDIDEIYGEAGNDTISGGDGDDIIEGGNDSDTIYGYELDRLADSLASGVTDNDVLRGGRGFDRIAGGPGDDLIYGDQDGDILLGNEGSDTIEGNDGSDTIYGFHFVSIWSPVSGGSDRSNRLFGNQDDDEIYGGPESDFIRGNSGDDTIDGNEGNDEIIGDDGNDVLRGGSQADTIDGGIGNDMIEGNSEEDQLYGNRGIDTILGDQGADLIAGNDQSDFIYGDEGNDTIYGGSGNDTLRGGEDDDTIHGDSDDDLIIGFSGADTLFGNDGDDVIYGGKHSDTIEGGRGNDRLYGELGDDTLAGNDGDDVAEGGAGDDSISGDDGNDALYGDDGQDTLHGGTGDDFLFAGDGISNLLNGDEGNDLLVGSDEGDEDPKFGDTTYFGDRLNGGEGDDTIEGLGGADEIDGGSGNNTIHGGTHTDRVVNGADTPGSASYQMPAGPERRGRWSELSRSASFGGLTNVGGFEEAVYVDLLGIYVAWVDWRNGNSEVYVAYHPFDVGGWTPLVGFGGMNSASGGGISNDSNQSRRPTLFKTESSDSLVVAWTSIAPDGTSTIEVAREDTNWTRIPNPAQTSDADDAQFVQFGDHSGLLFWKDTDPATHERTVAVAQYVYGQGCINGFLPARAVATLPVGEELKDYEAAAVEFQAVVAVSYGDANDQDIVVRFNGANLANESTFCPAVPNVNFEEYVSGVWRTLHTITDGDTQQPTIGIQYIDQRGFVRGEIELAYDVAVAWEVANGRENQVDGLVIQVRLDNPPAVIPMTPQYQRDASARWNAATLSDTRGYADKPSIDASYFGTYLAWRDDSVFAGDGRSSVYVLGRYRDAFSMDYVLNEEQIGDASGGGISATGGALRELSLALSEDGFMGTSPVVLWNEARAVSVPMSNGTSVAGSNAYLRVTLDGLEAVDDRVELRKFGRYQGNVLDNDLNIDGEFEGFVSMFDRFELRHGDVEVVEFTSSLGAKVTAGINGNVTYNPRGVPAFRALKRNESLTESFVYRVNNGIHEAEGTIEFIVYGGNAWRNDRNPVDVDDDRFVSPLDVLILVNDINANGTRELDDLGPATNRFLDVDDDGSISPLDVLMVINAINANFGRGGEGEGQSYSNGATVRTPFGSEEDATALASYQAWLEWYEKRKRI